jgi:hypothetical protein
MQKRFVDINDETGKGYTRYEQIVDEKGNIVSSKMVAHFQDGINQVNGLQNSAYAAGANVGQAMFNGINNVIGQLSGAALQAVLQLPAQIQQQVGQYYLQQPQYTAPRNTGQSVQPSVSNTNATVNITVNGAQVPTDTANAIVNELRSRGVLLPPRS